MQNWNWHARQRSTLRFVLRFNRIRHWIIFQEQTSLKISHMWRKNVMHRTKNKGLHRLLLLLLLWSLLLLIAFLIPPFSWPILRPPLLWLSRLPDLRHSSRLIIPPVILVPPFRVFLFTNFVQLPFLPIAFLASRFPFWLGFALFTFTLAPVVAFVDTLCLLASTLSIRTFRPLWAVLGYMAVLMALEAFDFIDICSTLVCGVFSTATRVTCTTQCIDHFIIIFCQIIRLWNTWALKLRKMLLVGNSKVRKHTLLSFPSLRSIPVRGIALTIWMMNHKAFHRIRQTTQEDRD